MGKVISEHRVSDVIFSLDGITYADILSVIANSNSRGVHFRLVPDSLEAIVGKTSIDPLDTLPFVDIEYNIQKPWNRTVKRLFDIAASLVLLVTAYPWKKLQRLLLKTPDKGGSAGVLLLLPQVFSGRLSMVGTPIDDEMTTPLPAGLPESGARDKRRYLGKPGLTGLVQINRREGLTTKERENYMLYYSKNQSMLLDLEILVKSILVSLR